MQCPPLFQGLRVRENSKKRRFDISQEKAKRQDSFKQYFKAKEALVWRNALSITLFYGDCCSLQCENHYETRDLRSQNS